MLYNWSHRAGFIKKWELEIKGLSNLQISEDGAFLMGKTRYMESFIDVIDVEKGNRIVKIPNTSLPKGFGLLNAHGLGTPYLITLNSNRLIQIYNILGDPTQYFTNNISRGIPYFMMNVLSKIHR